MKRPLRIALYCSVGFLVCLLAFALIQFSVPSLDVPTEETTTTKKKIPKSTSKKHQENTEFYLRVKNKGDCKALTGKILLNFILVSDGDCIYTPEAVETFKKTNEESIEFMKMDAAKYGVSLEVICNYVPCTMTVQIPRDDMQSWISTLAAEAGFADRSRISPSLEESFGVDSAPTFFCFNRSERSFCIPSSKESGFEYGVLYGKTEDFRHELYHLYGARDLYTPESINAIAQKYYFDSIMRRGANGTYVDSLSAYLIGWTDQLDETAKAYLKEVDG